MQAIAIVILCLIGLSILYVFVVKPIIENFWEIVGGIAFIAAVIGVFVILGCLVVYATGNGNSLTNTVFLISIGVLVVGFGIYALAEKME
jgi:hypothetical protein